MKLEYYLKINYIQLTLAFEVLDLFSRGFPDFIAKRARLAPRRFLVSDVAVMPAFAPPPMPPPSGVYTGLSESILLKDCGGLWWVIRSISPVKDEPKNRLLNAHATSDEIGVLS